LANAFAFLPHSSNGYYAKAQSLNLVKSIKASGEFISKTMKGHITAECFARIREGWPGKLLVKGVLALEDATEYMALGADGLVVSNHGGRQLDAAPSVVSVLPGIRQAVGPDVPLLADSGARSGLDVARMLALGADFVLMGRPLPLRCGCSGQKGRRICDVDSQGGTAGGNGAIELPNIG
jgi:isopentenyl diphosphate isomerase/L-lactate dehydrogenase-like FMN-dependent dehydrogenase